MKADYVLSEKRLLNCSKRCDFLFNESHYTEITAEFRHLSRAKSKKRMEKDHYTPFFSSKPARGLNCESMMAHNDSTVFLVGPLSP